MSGLQMQSSWARCARCRFDNPGVNQFCSACGSALQQAPAAPTTWRELPAGRKRLVVGLIAGSILAGVVIVANGPASIDASGRVLRLLSWGLGAVLGVLRTFQMFYERRPKYLGVLFGLLTLVLGLGFFDAVVTFGR